MELEEEIRRDVDKKKENKIGKFRNGINGMNDEDEKKDAKYS